MTTLIITQGLPGSGKTSWARTLGCARVNRDDLRDMLHGVRDHTPEHEEQVTLASHAAVRALLAAGVDVVVDDTNLPRARVERWRTLAGEYDAVLVVADWFLRVPVDVCIRRQANRPRREAVPAQVIRTMWAQYQGEQAAAEACGAA